VRVLAGEAAAWTFFTGEKITDSGRQGSWTFARTGNYKSNVPGSDSSGHTSSNSDIFQIARFVPDVKGQKGSPVRNKR
jgi:hypothetical protein